MQQLLRIALCFVDNDDGGDVVAGDESDGPPWSPILIRHDALADVRVTAPVRCAICIEHVWAPVTSHHERIGRQLLERQISTKNPETNTRTF